MPLGSGLASQIGYGVETTYGTRVAPTRFLELVSESLGLNINRVESSALRAGQRVLGSDRWVAGKRSAAGEVVHEVANKGFGLPFKHMLGQITSTQPDSVGNPTVWEHDARLADPAGLAFTVQVGVPDVGGTVRPFDYVGAKVTSWELSNGVDGLLLLKLSLDAQDEKTDQALAAASYPSGQDLLSWAGGKLTIAGAQVDVTDISLTGGLGLKTDRFLISNSTLKKQPIANARAAIAGKVTAEFENLTAYNRFVNGTTATIVASWTGATITGAFKFAVEVTLQVCRFDGETPKVSGPDVIMQPLPFVALDDRTNPVIKLVYRTTDTTP